MDDDGLLVDDRKMFVLISRQKLSFFNYSFFFALPGPGDSVRWALPGVVEQGEPVQPLYEPVQPLY